MKSSKNNNKYLFNSWCFGKLNYLLFGISLLIILIGYIIMASGETESLQSVKIAPILLTIGYCILLPLSIIIQSKNN